MIGTLAVALVTGAPLLVALGVLRMLKNALELLISIGHESYTELRRIQTWAHFFNELERTMEAANVRH